MTDARYDGHADWCDTTFRAYGGKDGSAGLLGQLLGPADSAGQICLDIGCGTGLHIAAVTALGYTLLGVDLSSDQLRIARTRHRRVAQADARWLPLPNRSVSVVTMTFTHTDMDDFATVVGEAARVLRSDGRLIYLGLHPCYVGAFVDRNVEADERRLRLTAGYGDESLQYDTTGRFPVRSRVGSRSLTLATLLNAFLEPGRLRIDTIAEYDTNLRPWRTNANDGRLVPWNIALIAHATGT